MQYPFKKAACALAFAALGSFHAGAHAADIQPGWPGAGQLFVGANYQPVDRNRAQIAQDIALMKQAGFNIVRVGEQARFAPVSARYFRFTALDEVWRGHLAAAAELTVIPALAE